MKKIWLAVFTVWTLTALTGCVLVGYSSRGGFFLWPGGLGLAGMVLLLLWMLLRRR